MTDLVPSVGAGERRRRCRSGNSLVEVLKTLVKLGLLLVNYSDAKADFLGALEMWRYLQHRQKRFERIFEASVAIVQKADAVPQIRVLRVRQMTQRTLVCLVRLV